MDVFASKEIAKYARKNMYQIRSFYPLVKMKAYFFDLNKKEIHLFLDQVIAKTLKKNGKMPENNIYQYIEVIKIDKNILPEFARILGNENIEGKFHEWTKTCGTVLSPRKHTQDVVFS